MYDRMPRAVILETPKPPQFKPELPKTQFLAAGPVGSAEVNRTPWGGKSMGWEILGKSMSKSRFFGNPGFGEKSRFENKLAVFHKKIKYLEICIMFRYWIFDAVPAVVLPDFVFRKENAFGI